METAETTDAAPPIRRHRPGQTGRVLVAVALAVVVAVAAYGIYGYATGHTSGEPTLVIYTYASLFNQTNDSAAIDQQVFGAFEAAHHVHIEVVHPGGTLLGTLRDESNAPFADVVIGLDEVTAPEAAARGLLIPYTSPQLSHVPAPLTAEIAPDHSVTPYEWGYLAFDYNNTFWNATRGAVANASFEQIASNSTWASNLLIEDPTVDITGEEFLLWQIEYAQHVQHTNWTGFWQSVDKYVRTAPDWGTAFTEFSTPPNPPGMLVSYSTDPAYEAYFGVPSTFGSTVAHSGGVSYGWKSIYGVGIVSGTRHLSLDQQFVDWFLSGTVQSEIPTGEWEYPANDTIGLPSVYDRAIPPGSITALNDQVTPAQIAANLTTWLDEWQTVDNNFG
ncbi:MAG: thiamine ABC transporter substrate-binding protein [Thermoplasmata archaeon]|nr:thiamine ABC transporter substrate-binding protein [Thermoplasmata archaeon]